MMEAITVQDKKEILKHARLIGVGTTAYIYLLPNGKAFKIYKNDYRKYLKYRDDKTQYFFERLHELDNSSYLCPEQIVLSLDGDVLGFIMDYKKASTLRRLSKKSTLEDIKRAIPDLIRNTNFMSDADYKICDMHQKNMLFDGSFYVVDVDGGCFYDSDSMLHKTNARRVYSNIIESIFRAYYEQIVIFDDNELQSKYSRVTDSLDHEAFFEFLDLMEDRLEIKNPTIKEMRKEKSKILTIHDKTWYHY